MDIEDTAASSADNAWYGVFLAGEGAAEVFWRMTCPCGMTVTFALNKLPEADTLFPCGHPLHWVIKYKADRRLL